MENCSGPLPYRLTPLPHESDADVSIIWSGRGSGTSSHCETKEVTEWSDLEVELLRVKERYILRGRGRSGLSRDAEAAQQYLKAKYMEQQLANTKPNSYSTASGSVTPLSSATSSTSQSSSAPSMRFRSNSQNSATPPNMSSKSSSPAQSTTSISSSDNGTHVWLSKEFVSTFPSWLLIPFELQGAWNPELNLAEMRKFSFPAITTELHYTGTIQPVNKNTQLSMSDELVFQLACVHATAKLKLTRVRASAWDQADSKAQSSSTSDSCYTSGESTRRSMPVTSASASWTTAAVPASTEAQC